MVVKSPSFPPEVVYTPHKAPLWNRSFHLLVIHTRNYCCLSVCVYLLIYYSLGVRLYYCNSRDFGISDAFGSNHNSIFWNMTPFGGTHILISFNNDKSGRDNVLGLVFSKCLPFQNS